VLPLIKPRGSYGALIAPWAFSINRRPDGAARFGAGMKLFEKSEHPIDSYVHLHAIEIDKKQSTNFLPFSIQNLPTPGIG
jgi:hypothetical protein